MLNNFDVLKTIAGDHGNVRVAVAGAACAETLDAVRDIVRMGSAQAMLFGDAAQIAQLCEPNPFMQGSAPISHCPTDEAATAAAVQAVRTGAANILMKGNLQTATLLRAVLDKNSGIRAGGLLSHIAALEMPTYPRLMFITDGGMNPRPDVQQKKHILQNAVGFLHTLGIAQPNVALLCAAETPGEKMPETMDAAQLAQMSKAGEITGCIVEGPVSMDIALSAESAQKKGFASAIAGCADIFVTHDIASGNILSKALIYLAHAKMAGCVLGAQAPIILTSRGAGAQEKLLSFLLCIAAINNKMKG